MKRFSQKTLATLTTLLLVFFISAAPAAAQTQQWTGVCVEEHNGTQVATIQGAQCLIANVLSVAVQGIGLAGFAMLIIGSFRYMLSGGNAKGAESARNTVTFAIVGLVVALSAFIILRLISQFTGVEQILFFRLSLPQ